jgi:recombination protein RecR
MSAPEIERLIQFLARLPGLGPRSARRAALHLMKRRESLMQPLAESLRQAAERLRSCGRCGNLDSSEPCAICADARRDKTVICVVEEVGDLWAIAICADARRDKTVICVVEEVGDLWAIERSGAFKGLYQVLGGTLSALDGRGPEDLRLDALTVRAGAPEVAEVILALSATVDGQTTGHYIAERLAGSGVTVSRLAHGVPIGGELDYLDDGTLSAALKARRPA